MEKSRYPAVFLDRDGVLTIERKRISMPDEVELYEGVAEAVRDIHRMGYFVIVTTNQSGIARGLFSEEEIRQLHDRLKAETGVDEIYYCPHHIDGKIEKYRINCNCRKPKIGMIEQAMSDFPIDINHSWMVGDRETDIQFGKNAGIRTVLVRTGYGEETLKKNIDYDDIVDDIWDFVRLIRKNDNEQSIEGTRKEI
ncbi:MAG: HAD family hydrolase [Lachnospiraceae bacterium]|nr:HAD family hydrolase [Lachnospiraceae bacterium]